jgi:hypothetical protein
MFHALVMKAVWSHGRHCNEYPVTPGFSLKLASMFMVFSIVTDICPQDLAYCQLYKSKNSMTISDIRTEVLALNGKRRGCYSQRNEDALPHN